ncbi:MAG: hypothetical protein V2B14_03170 [bacterium]
MENLSQNIQQPLMLLLYSTVVMLIIITVFMVKLLNDLSNLAKSLQNITVTIDRELEPTIKELQNALSNINSLSSNVGIRVNDLNNTFSNGLNALSDSTVGIYSKSKIILSSLKQGIITGLGIFLKKR